jgi:hypothetical protein
MKIVPDTIILVFTGDRKIKDKVANFWPILVRLQGRKGFSRAEIARMVSTESNTRQGKP